MSGAVLVERAGGVIRLTLNRPDKLNAFNIDMHDGLKAAFDAIEADSSCRAVLLTGAGRAFSTGQDLSERKRTPGAPPRDLGQSLDTYFNPLVRRMRALPKPIVVAVNGVAAGASANVAFHGDVILAARSARFIEPFCRLGLVPDAGGTWLLARALGEARAKAVALLGDPLTADEALAAGLIGKVVDDDALMPDAEATAAALAEGPTAGYAAIKEAIHAAGSSTLDAALDLERDLNRTLGFSHDYAEGVAAFLEKRKPCFTGKL
jgi:2-(1,2-epoxy-1,2-dihydrophenyl)acetyl-CoA isomerase